MAQLQGKLTVTNSKTEPAKQNYPWHTNVTKAFRKLVSKLDFYIPSIVQNKQLASIAPKHNMHVY